jgi:hypothetical protein
MRQNCLIVRYINGEVNRKSQLKPNKPASLSAISRLAKN